MTADRDFLLWLAERLVHQYNEHEDVDFVQKVRGIAHAIHPTQDTWPSYSAQKAKDRFRVYLNGHGKWDVWDFENNKAIMTYEREMEALGSSGWFNLQHQCNQSLAAKLPKEEEEPETDDQTITD